MQITILSTPYLEDGFLEEAQMVRTALLYGDRVTLVRVNIAYEIINLLREDGLMKVLASNNPLVKKHRRKYRNEYLAAKEILEPFSGPQALDKFVDRLMDNEDIPAEIKQDLELYKSTGEDAEDVELRARRAEIDEKVRASYDMFIQQAQEEMASQYDDALGTQNRLLEAARQNGLLDLKEFMKVGYDRQACFSDLAVELSGALTSVDTFPMLSELFGQALSAISDLLAEEERPLQPTTLIRAKQIPLAKDLLTRLPLFENASLDQIIDIRSDLRPYLVPFRAALIRLSEQIKETPWNDEFPLEVDLIFHREVAPAIHAIEAEVKSRKYLSELVSKLVTSPLVVPGGSLVGLALTQLSSLPSVITQPLTVGGAFGLLSYEAYRDWKEKLAATQQNQLYFLFRVSDLLSRPRRMKRVKVKPPRPAKASRN